MDICAALAAIHSLEPPIVHRDVKPENIMEREGGGYVLIDFDAARIYDENARADTQCIATVGYAAPEQYGLSQTDVRSDIFSLGVTLYELKTGEAFHMGAVCGGLFKNIIAKCTAFAPEKRFQNADQLLRKLTALRPQNRRARSKRRIAILFLASAAALLMAVFFGTKGKEPAEAVPPATPEQPAASAVLASSAYEEIPCTCHFQTGVLTSPGGLVLKFDGTPLKLQLTLTNCAFDRKSCNALNHYESAALSGCRIQNMSVGASAEITDGGELTINAEGAYIVDALVTYGDHVGGPVEAIVFAAAEPNAYAACSCALNVNKTYPVFNYDQTLPADGSPLYLELRVDPVYDRRLCTASEHHELLPLMGYIELAPEGAECGVTEDNRFYTYTAGEYEVRTPALYNGALINFGCRFVVTQAKSG